MFARTNHLMGRASRAPTICIAANVWQRGAICRGCSRRARVRSASTGRFIVSRCDEINGVILNRLLATAFFFLTTTLAMAQERPPPGYENWGVCPFECCTYREWTADADIPIHESRNDKSAIVFRLHRDENIQALTGVVVTEKPGAVLIDKPVRDGFIKGTDKPQLSLRAGDIVYMLSPLGEGFYLFWYQGKVYKSGVDLAAMPGVEGREAKMTWWKLVKNRAGRSGWTDSDKFGNVDACG